jgi:hypothetical protein
MILISNSPRRFVRQRDGENCEGARVGRDAPSRSPVEQRTDNPPAMINTDTGTKTSGEGSREIPPH